jgi:phage gpG-like protein
VILHIEDFGTIAKQERRLLGMMDAAVDLRPVMDDIYWDMANATTVMFTSEGRRGGGSWRDTLEKTKEKRIKMGYKPLPILNMSGRLASSATEPLHPEHHRDVGKDSVEIGTSVPYAATHQLGRPSKNITRRPFLVFYEFDRIRWAKMISRFLIKMYSKAGKGNR